MKIFIVFFLISFVLFQINPAIIKITDENESVIQNEIITDDYLFAGDILTFTGKADDLYFAGETLLFTGETSSSVVAFGNNIDINGNVGNNLIIAAKTVKINGTINGTVFIGAMDVIISKSAKINGDIFLGCSSANIDGRINGKLKVGAKNLTISNTVTGKVTAGVKNIKLIGNGKISGDLNLYSSKGLSIDEEKKVGGTISYNKIKDKHFGTKMKPQKAFKGIKIFFKIAMFLSFLIGGLLVLLFPSMKTLENDRSVKGFWFTGLWGLIPFFIYPVAIGVLFILGLTAFLGIILAAAVLPILFITKLIGVTMLGQYLFGLFKWNKKKRHLFFLIGCTAYVILSIIPFINVLAFIFLSSLGWGFILEKLFDKKFVK